MSDFFFYISIYPSYERMKGRKNKGRKNKANRQAKVKYGRKEGILPSFSFFVLLFISQMSITTAEAITNATYSNCLAILGYSSDTLLEHTIITLTQVMCLMAYWPQQLLYETAITSHTHYTYMHICISDLLSKIWALSANIEFSILSVPVGFQSNSDYCTNVLQGVCTVLY